MNNDVINTPNAKKTLFADGDDSRTTIEKETEDYVQTDVINTTMNMEETPKAMEE